MDKDGNRPGVKQSVRWVEGYERLAEMAAELPSTRLVYLADREADIMELIRARRCTGHARGLAAALPKHNRTLSGGDKPWSRVMASESLGEIRFVMAPRQGQRAREVLQQVWAQTLELPDGKGRFVQASCIGGCQGSCRLK